MLCQVWPFAFDREREGAMLQPHLLTRIECPPGDVPSRAGNWIVGVALSVSMAIGVGSAGLSAGG